LDVPADGNGVLPSLPPSSEMIGLSRLAACVAIAAQCAGLVLALLTPLDNQGFVGKAMWAVFAQFVALPSAGIGLMSAICSRLLARGKEEPRSLTSSLTLNAAGLIPVSVIYLQLRYG
jgi:hypothetical protein